ncbi:MAG: hypothetical protein JSV84_01870, partial [Gemmatimonadota bacterium]
GNLTSLRILNIDYTQLSGSLPPEIGNCTELIQIFADNNQLSGSIPPEIGNLTNMTTLWLQTNQLTDLPDLSSDTSLTVLKIQENKLTFEDIEPNVFVPDFTYSPQDSVGEEQDTTIEQGSSLELAVAVGGTANQYQWMQDGVDIPGAESGSYVLASADSSHAGSYVCRITSTIATELTLYSRPINVRLSGGGVCERGDVTCDGSIDLFDLLTLVNHILGTQVLEKNALWAANCNDDGEIDLLDLVGIVNVILGIGECEP